MNGVVFLDLIVRLPDGAQTCRLGRHDVDADAEVHGQRGDAGSRELEHAVFDEAVFINRTAQRYRHVLRSDAAPRRAREIDEHRFGPCDVIGAAQQLLDELGPALADAHRAQRAIARVAVRAEDHPSAAGELLARILMYDGEVGRDEDAAVFPRGGEAEGVVVGVYRPADGAQRVVAVRHDIGKRKLPQPAAARCLDYADIGDVVGNEAVKAQAPFVPARARVVRGHYRIGHRFSPPGLGTRAAGVLRRHAVMEINAALVQFEHGLHL